MERRRRYVDSSTRRASDRDAATSIDSSATSPVAADGGDPRANARPGGIREGRPPRATPSGGRPSRSRRSKVGGSTRTAYPAWVAVDTNDAVRTPRFRVDDYEYFPRSSEISYFDPKSSVEISRYIVFPRYPVSRGLLFSSRASPRSRCGPARRAEGPSEQPPRSHHELTYVDGLPDRRSMSHRPNAARALPPSTHPDRAALGALTYCGSNAGASA